MLLPLHPDIIVHVVNVVSVFSSPSTSSQKVQKRAAIYSVASWSIASPELPKFAELLLPLHPDIIVHVVNVVSLFSSPSTSSQKVQKRAAIYSGQLVLLVNFYHCFSGVAQVCRDAAGK